MPEYAQRTIVPFMPDHVELVYSSLDPKAFPSTYFDFLRGYIRAADSDLEDGERWSGIRWHRDAVTAAVLDTVKFFNAHRRQLNELYFRAGVHFAEARSGGGVTFEDTWDEFVELGEALQKDAQTYRELDAYLGDDVLLHSGSEIRHCLAGTMKLEGMEK